MQAIEMQTTLGHDIDKDAVARAYDRWAPVYDLVFGPVFERGRQAAIAAAERVGGRILEVGVGTGISLPDYSNKNRITGVDISPTMLRKAQDRVRELGLKHVEGLAVMDAADLKFEDNSFDVVVAQYVVTTVPDPEGTLDEFARVLKPGGEIILVSRVGAEAGLRKSRVDLRAFASSRCHGNRVAISAWRGRKTSVRSPSRGWSRDETNSENQFQYLSNRCPRLFFRHNPH